MIDMAETLQQEYERLKALRSSAITSDSVDGASTTFDQKVVAKNLVQVEVKRGTRKKRSRVITPNMTRR